MGKSHSNMILKTIYFDSRRLELEVSKFKLSKVGLSLNVIIKRINEDHSYVHRASL